MRNLKRKKTERGKWSEGDLQNAISSMGEGSSLREAARLYNIPLATLHDRISTDKVDMRIYRRKSSRAKFGEDVVRRAVIAHVVEKRSLQSVSEESGIPKRTLARYCQKYREAGVDPNDSSVAVGYRRCRQIFTREDEIFFCEYLRKAAEAGHTLTPLDVRKLAYSYASANQMLIPTTWRVNSMAGDEWYNNFKRRNPWLMVSHHEEPPTAGASANLSEAALISAVFGTHWLADLLPGFNHSVGGGTSFTREDQEKSSSSGVVSAAEDGSAAPGDASSEEGESAARGIGRPLATPVADGESSKEELVLVKASKSKRKSVTPMKISRTSCDQDDGSTSDE